MGLLTSEGGFAGESTTPLCAFQASALKEAAFNASLLCADFAGARSAWSSDEMASDRRESFRSTDAALAAFQPGVSIAVSSAGSSGSPSESPATASGSDCGVLGHAGDKRKYTGSSSSSPPMLPSTATAVARLTRGS